MTKPKAFLLGLQPRFVPLVKDGSKTHTIRGERKDGKRPQPGDMITIYTGLRTKACEFVMRAPCIRTENIEISEDRVLIGDYSMVSPGNLLSRDEADSLAWKDGFRHMKDGQYTSHVRGCFRFMMQFWDGRLPFHGWITHWDYSKAEFERYPVKPVRSVRGASRRFEMMIHEGEQQEYGL